MLILLIIHIFIAISGLLVAAISLVKLSNKSIRLSYILTAGTLATGTGLVFMTGNVLKSCLSGLGYLSAVLIMTAIAKHRLASAKVSIH